MRKILFLSAYLLCICACLEVRYYEDEEILLSDRDHVIAVSENDILDDGEIYDQSIYDTLHVTTNRSFHASIVPEVEWVHILDPECVNLSGISEEVPVVLVFARNRNDLIRETSLVISAKGKRISIPVSQVAPVYFIKAEPDKEEVLGVRDTCTLKVRSNTKWTATIDPERTTADVVLSKIAGRDNGSVKLCFGMNDDFDNGKKATVIFHADGCESVAVEVSQRDGSPFVTFLGNDFESKPEEEFIPLSITANVPWKIETLESSFVNGVIVTRDSYEMNPKDSTKWVKVSGGEYVEGGRYAYVGEHGSDPTVIKSAKLRVTTVDGTYADEINFQQRGCIHLDFLDINPSAIGTTKPYRDCYDIMSWPFEYPNYTEMCFSWNGCILDPVKYPFDGHLYGEVECILKCGYTMPIRTNGYEGDDAEAMGGGLWYQKNSKGLQLSYCMNGYDYIKTPIVPGMALKKVIFEPSVFGVNTVCIRECGDSNDATILPEAVPGAVQWKYLDKDSAYKEHELVFEHEFKTLENNKAYRVSFEQATCCSSIKELVFIYE